ncbi:MAG: hypothetical protein ACLT3Y_02665 [Ruminococcus callidus]
MSPTAGCVCDRSGHADRSGKDRIADQNAEARKTPLQMTLDQFGKRLSIGIMMSVHWCLC